jgi:guanosine-3',5'-bis(diphosphate) 3'-pyrophosphohydrolase
MKVLKAALFAKKKHEKQLRKYNNQPYIMHPARVVSRAMLFDDITEVEFCAAWLHDVIEDCRVKPQEIANLFGDEVAALVLELTNPSKNLPKEALRAEKKRVDREHLKTVSFKAKRLKLIDRLDNCYDLEKAPLDFVRLYSVETKALLECIGDAVPELNNEILQQLKYLEHNSRIYGAMQKIGG